MSKTIRKTSIALAILMSFLMVFTLLPLNVKAQEVITIEQDDLDNVKNNPTSHIDTEKGIEYFVDSKVFNLYEAVEYRLEGDLEFDGEILDVSSEDGASILNLNGHRIDSKNTSQVGAVVNSKNTLTIKGDGYIFVEDTSEGAIYAQGEVVAIHALNDMNIESGEIHGVVISDKNTFLNISKCNVLQPVTINGSLSLSGGHFWGEFKVYGSADISGGFFYENTFFYGTTVVDNAVFSDGDTTFAGNTLINDGILADMVYIKDTAIINGGEFYNLYISNDEKDTNLTINDGVFLGTLDFMGGSGIINGGSFGQSSSYAVLTNQMDYLEINGGEFVGNKGALRIDGDTEVYLSGGKYTALGSESSYLNTTPDAAIFITSDNFVFDEACFDKLLKEGYEYIPEAQANLYVLQGEDKGAYTQKDIMILPKEANIVTDEGSKDLNTQVNALINKLKAGESVEGISPELAEELLSAIATGKSVSVSLEVSPVNPENISEDAAKVNALVGSNGSIAAYFDVNIAINIDGDTIGYITKLDDGVVFRLPIPDDLPALASGMIREYKIVRVHNGLAKELAAETEDGYVNAKSAEFSTYALVYNDKGTPATGDYGFTPWLIILAPAAASIVFAVKVRKFKNE